MTTTPADPEPTIRLGIVAITASNLGQVVQEHCPHCNADTVQVHKPGRMLGVFQDTCLQCIADGGTCCSIARFNRWSEETP